MRFLRKPGNFASAGNYSAPGLPWDAQPRLIIPDDSAVSNGATPNQPDTAQRENGRYKVIWDTMSVQAFAALTNWSSYIIPQVGTDVYTIAVGMRRVRAAPSPTTETQRKLYLFGLDSADSNKTRQAISNDGSIINANTNKPTNAQSSPSGVYPGTSGELVLLTNGSITYSYTTNSGTTWSQTTASGGTEYGFHYVPSGVNAGYYWAGSSGAITVTKKTTISGGTVTAQTATSPDGSAASSSTVEFADNGSVLMFVAITVSTGAAVVYRTLNGGTTWSLSANFGTGKSAINITWNEALGLFFVWCSDGTIIQSADGAAWTTVSTAATFANGFIANGPGSFVSLGPAIVHATTSSDGSAGIAFSFDNGANNSWYYHYYNDGVNNYNPRLRVINNRIYALDANGKILYRSGIVGMPALTEL